MPFHKPCTMFLPMLKKLFTISLLLPSRRSLQSDMAFFRHTNRARQSTRNFAYNRASEVDPVERLKRINNSTDDLGNIGNQRRNCLNQSFDEHTDQFNSCFYDFGRIIVDDIRNVRDNGRYILNDGGNAINQSLCKSFRQCDCSIDDFSALSLTEPVIFTTASSPVFSKVGKFCSMNLPRFTIRLCAVLASFGIAEVIPSAIFGTMLFAA